MRPPIKRHPQIGDRQRLNPLRRQPRLIELIEEPSNRPSIRRTIPPRSQPVAGEKIKSSVPCFRHRTRLSITSSLGCTSFRATQTLTTAMRIPQNLLQDRPLTRIDTNRNRSRSPSHIRH